MEKCILILDDCLNCLQNYHELLELEGYNVLSSTSALEAFNIVRQCSPALLICDIKMSEVDGFGFIRMLKAFKSTESIPFIFHSAVTESPQVNEALNLGALAFLAKPCPTDLFITTIDHHFEVSNSFTSITNNLS